MEPGVSEIWAAAGRRAVGLGHGSCGAPWGPAVPRISTGAATGSLRGCLLPAEMVVDPVLAINSSLIYHELIISTVDNYDFQMINYYYWLLLIHHQYYYDFKPSCDCCCSLPWAQPKDAHPTCRSLVAKPLLFWGAVCTHSMNHIIEIYCWQHNIPLSATVLRIHAILQLFTFQDWCFKLCFNA